MVIDRKIICELFQIKLSRSHVAIFHHVHLSSVLYIYTSEFAIHVILRQSISNQFRGFLIFYKYHNHDCSALHVV
jgi:hypothetical protein